MKLRLPALYRINNKSRVGRVRQLLASPITLSGSAVKFTIEKHSGLRFTPEDGGGEIYLFKKPPAGSGLPAAANMLVANDFPTEPLDDCNVTHGKWLQHELLPADAPPPVAEKCAAQARSSWQGCFHYVDEEAARGAIALRPPQLGALHAIHAHWSVSSGVATIVMPTGTGKTETMLATLTSAQCQRVLVLVPTDALRIQITEKFLSLGILKQPNNVILDDDSVRPVVGMLTAKPKTVTEVDEFFAQCNVVVTSSQLAGGCAEEIQARMAFHCSHLFIDEAHHAEAPTWKSFKDHFTGKRILQFTATPFREDDKLIDGKIIYAYPLRKAQAEGYFRPIRFNGVFEFGIGKSDAAIAEKVLEELNHDGTGKHVAMARVATTERATQIFDLYRSLGHYDPVVLHTKISAQDREAARAKLFRGESRIVICVDMLGEGFDMPELKIAAFHDLRKSLSVTLQLAGRFTRARADLGDPVFIANTANVDLREELLKLYAQDPDWNALLPELSEAAIADEIGAQEFLSGFKGTIDEIPLKDLRPAASTVIYRTNCANWTPKEFAKGIKGRSKYERIYPILNEQESTLVIVTAAKRGVSWTDVSSVQEFVWELFIAYWDHEQHLLFIHGSSNSGEFKDLAKALCGDSVSIIVDPIVYRAFHGINRLVLTNVGLDEHFGRQIRYTGRMGPDVGSRLSDSTKQGARKAVLAGLGYEKGGRASIGAAKRGRVWSAQRLRIDTFAGWCRHIGKKIADTTIDPEAVLKGTLVPREISERPKSIPIGVDWPIAVLDFVESATSISWPTGDEVHLTDVGIEVTAQSFDAPLVIRVFTKEHEVFVKLELFKVGDSTDFRFVYDGAQTATIRRGQTYDLCEFLTKFPPTIWFADGASLEGNLHVELTVRYGPYDSGKLVVGDWAGIDITSESQGESRVATTVQYRTIERLKRAGGYDIIFDDDGAGEAADIVAIRVDKSVRPHRIDVEFYHCKYSGAEKPGARVDDLYIVCGQAQRSVMWLHTKERRTDLFAHLLKRESSRVDQGKATRFEIGDKDALARLRDMSRTCEVHLSVWAVQPGVSKAAVSGSQLALLSVAEHYLHETYQVPFALICSD